MPTTQRICRCAAVHGLVAPATNLKRWGLIIAAEQRRCCVHDSQREKTASQAIDFNPSLGPRFRITPLFALLQALRLHGQFLEFS